MTTLICSTCRHDLYTASPKIWEGYVHIGCGGRYEVEKEIFYSASKNSEFLNCPHCGYRKEEQPAFKELDLSFSPELKCLNAAMDILFGGGR